MRMVVILGDALGCGEEIRVKKWVDVFIGVSECTCTASSRVLDDFISMMAARCNTQLALPHMVTLSRKSADHEFLYCTLHVVGDDVSLCS